MIFSSPSFDDFDCRAMYGGDHSTTADMLSSTQSWGSASQYSGGTSSYPSSTSSAQSYYNGRPAMVAPTRTQQNLPSLTEMNLNTTNYVPRTSHSHAQSRHPSQLSSPPVGSSYFTHTTDPIDMTYNTPKPILSSPYTASYSTFSPRASYTHNPQFGSSITSFSPTIDPYAYSNGHSWPPSLPYPSNYPNMSDAASISSGRRRRGNLPKHVTDILRSWFHDHLDHPYPTDEDKQMLISRTNLTISQISNWFINARRRHWPQLKAERERTMQVQGVGYQGGLGKP